MSRPLWRLTLAGWIAMGNKAKPAAVPETTLRRLKRLFYHPFSYRRRRFRPPRVINWQPAQRNPRFLKAGCPRN